MIEQAPPADGGDIADVDSATAGRGDDDRATIRLRRYRRLAIITTAGVVLLTVAGGVVRLTGSGLGCDDWPNCNDTRFIDVSSGHTVIEQVNRLLSGVIGLPTLLLAIMAFLVRRPGLRWPALGVLVSVLANGVVGGLAVRGDLHPALVQSHFLLAMVSIAFGVIAVMRSGPIPIDRTQPNRSAPGSPGIDSARPFALGGIVLAVASGAALVTGTIVTGTGPHAGDEDVRRFGFDISNVARTHSVTVLVTLAIAIWLAWRVNRLSPRSPLASSLSTWLFVGLLQGAIGYAQYFNGVPELLVGVHIALAAGLWVLNVRLVVHASTSTAGSEVVAVGGGLATDDAAVTRSFLGAESSRV
ncbi:MAG: COX15/CtaA family protein [Actinomycetota bacterium]